MSSSTERQLADIAEQQRRYKQSQDPQDLGFTEEGLEVFLEGLQRLSGQVNHKVGREASDAAISAYREAAGEQYQFAKPRNERAISRRTHLRWLAGGLLTTTLGLATIPPIWESASTSLRAYFKAENERKSQEKAAEEAENRRRKLEFEGNRTIGLGYTHTTLNGWVFSHPVFNPNITFTPGLLYAEIPFGKELGFPQGRIADDFQTRLLPYVNSNGSIVPQLRITTKRWIEPQGRSSVDKENTEDWVIGDQISPDPKVDRRVIAAENRDDPALRSLKVYLGISIRDFKDMKTGTFIVKNFETTSER
jgi:hypothetical protein